MIKVIVKKPNEDFEVKELECCDYRAIEKLIDCEWTDRVRLGHELMMYVDDVGHCRKLPLNFLIEMTSRYFPIQEIVGTVVVARTEMNDVGDDFDWVSITENDIMLFKGVLKRSEYLLQMSKMENNKES